MNTTKFLLIARLLLWFQSVEAEIESCATDPWEEDETE